MQGRVLTIAGSDSSGGAGIQADIKTITALGGYAASAITALTAQNTKGVHGVMPVPPEFVVQQIEVVLSDIGADAIKIGMLGTRDMIEAVAGTLKKCAASIPIVLDPVMIAKGGADLLEPSAVEAMGAIMVPMAAVVTPNIPEAERLTGLKIDTQAEMETAAACLRDMGAGAALVKGGHMSQATLIDVLVTENGTLLLEAERRDTPHTHGTGCTLASALATGLAQGMGMERALRIAHAYVQAAIMAAPGLGHGHGPLGPGKTITN